MRRKKRERKKSSSRSSETSDSFEYPLTWLKKVVSGARRIPLPPGHVAGSWPGNGNARLSRTSSRYGRSHDLHTRQDTHSLLSLLLLSCRRGRAAQETGLLMERLVELRCSNNYKTRTLVRAMLAKLGNLWIYFVELPAQNMIAIIVISIFGNNE